MSPNDAAPGAGQSVAAPPAKQRNLAFDAFRGLAILFVVMAHSVGYGWDFINHPTGQWNFYWSVFLRHVMLCALPTFLFVSGYWLGGTEFHSRADYVNFLRKRVSRIVIPYVFWSVAFFVLYAFRARSFDKGLQPLVDLSVKLVLGQAEGPYFFIVMLLQFYLLTPLFVYACKHTSVIKWIVATHILFVIALYGVRYFYFKDLSFSYVKLPFLSWFPFYLMGVYLRRHPDHLVPKLNLGTRPHALTVPKLAVFTGLFLVLSVLEALILIRQGYFEFGISDVKFTCFGYSVFALLLMYQLRNAAWPRVLALLGDYAFGIFFIHGIILRAVMGKLRGVSFLFEFQPGYQFLATFVTLAITCAIIYATRKVVGQKLARDFLGF